MTALSPCPSMPIQHLPGYGRPDEPHHAGFITIEDETNSNLFYWLVQHGKEIAASPLIIWLQGGPGSSSLEGLLTENIGPYSINDDLQLSKNEYSWNQLAHVMAVDHPVGTGFSYTNCPKRYVRSDEQGASDFLQFLLKFYRQHPEFRRCRLLLAGESYAGKYIPAIGDQILRWNESGGDRIDLQGLILVSPWIDADAQTPAYTEHAYRHDCLNDDQKREADELMEECIRLFRQGELLKSSLQWDVAAEYIYKCGGGFSPFDIRDRSGTGDDPSIIYKWLAQPEVRHALHVGDRQFSDGVTVFEALRANDMISSLPYLQQLLDRMPVLVLNGEHDWVCNHIGLETLLERFLVWDGKDERAPLPDKRDWRQNGELVGYSRHAGPLTQVVLMNSGHMVPQDQPELAFRLIQQFLNDVEPAPA